MLDTKGPEIRTGLLKDSKPVDLVAGQTLKIVTDYSVEGDSKQIACSYNALPQSVNEGSRILIADGSLTCKVTEKYDVSLICLLVFHFLFFFRITSLSFAKIPAS